MTVIITDEKRRSSPSEANILLLSKYQQPDKESLLDENSCHHEEKRCKWRMSRQKYFTYVTLLLVSWIGYLVYMYDGNMLLTKYSSMKSHSADCHPYNNPAAANIMDLPSKYLPTSGVDGETRRLIVIGDIHGMKDEMDRLLDKVEFNLTRDHLILVGDLIAKGPDSAGVVDLAMKLGATCVRGNHEDQVIQAWDDIQDKNAILAGDQVSSVSSKPYDKKHKHLAQSLGKERIDWIKTWPIILRVGDFGSMGEVVVAHAGLDSDLSLEEQDLYMVMNMRSIKHGVYTDKHNGKAWTKKWNKYQKSFQGKRRTIVYGHDAKRGLRIKNYSLGIDSACFNGHKLTAAIFEVKNDTYSFKLEQVKC
ncbi:putative metallophosphoesterase [Erysiphe neolycopersici]|uniref:Putative metallophosphoesterase n=1 Tax=Erysiphe neolycopersici TaxID=212602 RepID=A0A420HL56_9PEZI|nr:putative metallophosphoesterase [Erysiphe neolycopersici]